MVEERAELVMQSKRAEIDQYTKAKETMKRIRRFCMKKRIDVELLAATMDEDQGGSLDPTELKVGPP